LKRKHIIGILLLIFVLAATIYVVVYFGANQNSPNKYEKSIVRNTDTAEEENALTAAENVNYTDIFQTDWFYTGMSGFHFNLTDYSTGTPSATFIDAVVLKYYESRYESLKGKTMEMGFNYNANVSAWDRIRAVYVPPPENESIYAAKVRILSSNGTILNEFSESSGGNRYAWVGWNYAIGSVGWIDTVNPPVSGIPEYQVSAIDFEFTNCYMVEMRLGYTEVHGNLAGFWYNIYQTVIMDESFKPLFIRVQTQMTLS
jgi:hypothetical protein